MCGNRILLKEIDKVAVPKLRGPLFSVSAAGRLGNALVYQKRNFGHGVRARNFFKWKTSSSRQAVQLWWKKGFYVWRGIIAGFNYFISDYCYGLLQVQRDIWVRSSYAETLTGINYFMSRWIKRSLQGLPQYQLPPKAGFCLSGEWISGELMCGGKFEMGG